MAARGLLGALVLVAASGLVDAANWQNAASTRGGAGAAMLAVRLVMWLGQPAMLPISRKSASELGGLPSALAAQARCW